MAELTEPDVLPAIDGFTIERELGRGAMGVVYLAHRDMPSRRVALKLLPGGRRASPGERRQWLREAQAASLVRHPNVVTLYEVAETERWFLLALEYIPGGSLADRLSQPLAPTHAARLMETIARAVHHIHQSGQLHLDLKPSNILLDGAAAAEWDAMIPKVSDFGIARSAEPGTTDTGPTGPGGTPSYMAPEQISKPRKEMSAAADVHGMGAILYHMLTGRPPYQGATVLETVDQVQRLDPVPPRRFSSAIPRDLETICLKCLQKDPGRRYASAQALAEDLQRWLDGRPISARPASMAGKAWRWCRRRPVIAALAVALMLTLSVSFVMVIVLWRRSEAMWRRSEASFRMSAEMVDDLVDLVAGGGDGFQKGMTLDGLIQQLERLRKRQLVLAASQPSDLGMAHQLVRIEHSFAVNLMRAGRHEEARIVLLESVCRTEELIRRHPYESTPRDDLRRLLRGLASVAEKLGKVEGAIIYHKRLIESFEEEFRRTPPACFDSLIHNRRELAWLLYSRGDCEQARSLIAANQHSLRNSPAAYKGWTIAVERLLSCIDSSALLPGGSSETPSEAGNPETSSLHSSSRLASPFDVSQSPEDWARLAARALRCDDPDTRAAARWEAELTLEAMHHLYEMASITAPIWECRGGQTYRREDARLCQSHRCGPS